jgi:23S rRNA G2069 N7-methylase RlmK/C1962 C5-methylase RlmI
MSATYSLWCEDHLKANGFVGEAYPCVTEDAWSYVRRAVKAGDRFDLIIFDPPSFSNSRKMEHDFDVQRDHVRWLKMLNRLLTKDGLLLFSTNLGSFRIDKNSIQGYGMREITSEVAAPGFSKQRGVARSWLLNKEHEVRIPSEYLREPDAGKNAEADGHAFATQEEEPNLVGEKNKAREAFEEEKQ